ncbi:SOS response-associated peptidase [Leeia oryzae]|uniref:SOS response-associated peptidase n=1 Tax=Leeia oryzae TaxID=356662 RepID=UPI000382A5EF|nr:SOS response-associated peptidase family protein [Leeia oryzae]
MCINYLTPTPHQLRSHFSARFDHDADWPEEAWQDYAAPIILPHGIAKTASYGMIPKAHQPEGARLSTMNARAETLGERPAYRYAWQHTQFCLVPMLGFFEPCYESGKAERWQIGMADGSPFAVAGLWRTWQTATGERSHAFTQITINADDHPLMRRMHKPEDEKRSLVIVRPEEYDAWLTCQNTETARSFLRAYPGDKMTAFASPKAARVSQNLSLF